METKFARVHWTRVENRDDDKTYNKWTRADFARRAPGLPGTPHAGVYLDPKAQIAAWELRRASTGLLYRTTPSDAFQGVKLADLLFAKGVKDVALTYVNNDYGKSLADVFMHSDGFRRGQESGFKDVHRIHGDRHGVGIRQRDPRAVGRNHRQGVRTVEVQVALVAQGGQRRAGVDAQNP